jgi:phosphoribosylformylglycinamidine cyclo-ligase
MVDELRQQDTASETAYGWAKRTLGFRKGLQGQAIVPSVAQFSSWLDLGACKVAMTSDGIGTKIEIAERTGKYDTLGFDLMAMVTDDLAANGVEPVALSNTMDVDRIDHALVGTLMQGLHDAAKVANVSVVGGEIAELGSRIGGYGSGMHVNWCATAMGILRPTWDPIDGTKVRAGDAVLAVQSVSFRSNGFSTLRRGLGQKLGPNWHAVEWNGRTWGAWLLEPCRIYAPLMVALRASGLPLSGLAHITGGGLPSKLGRTLRANDLGANLPDLFLPPAFMEAARALCDVSLHDAYQHWNMGNGFMVILPEAEVAAALAVATRAGFEMQRAGTVTPEPTLRIHDLTYDLSHGVG